MTAVAATAASGDSDSNCSKRWQWQQLQQAVTTTAASSNSDCSKRWQRLLQWTILKRMQQSTSGDNSGRNSAGSGDCYHVISSDSDCKLKIHKARGYSSGRKFCSEQWQRLPQWTTFFKNRCNNQPAVTTAVETALALVTTIAWRAVTWP